MVSVLFLSGLDQISSVLLSSRFLRSLLVWRTNQSLIRSSSESAAHWPIRTITTQNICSPSIHVNLQPCHDLTCFSSCLLCLSVVSTSRTTFSGSSIPGPWGKGKWILIMSLLWVLTYSFHNVYMTVCHRSLYYNHFTLKIPFHCLWSSDAQKTWHI